MGTLAIVLIIIGVVVILMVITRRQKRFQSKVTIRRLDKNVQFTVYRPNAIEPKKWYSLITFAHLSERPPDAPSTQPDPKVEVERKAVETLGPLTPAYSDATLDSRLDVPRESVVTFEPNFKNLNFIPRQHEFLWEGKTHMAEFRMQASQELEGETVRGFMRVLWGRFILAEIPLAIEINTARAQELQNAPPVSTSATAYRKLFASYSRKDESVVIEFEDFAETVGDKYLRDVRDIRSGEVFDERIEELIREADLFQLFWSWNSMGSAYVRREWEYALSLNRIDFLRPTYWEEPMPVDEARGLPPPALSRLEFKKYKGHKKEAAPPKAEINVTPYSDVLLVVLIFVTIFGGVLSIWQPWNPGPGPATHGIAMGRSVRDNRYFPRISALPLTNPLIVEIWVGDKPPRLQGDVFRYYLRYRNQDERPLKNVLALVDLPDSLEYVGHTLTPLAQNLIEDTHMYKAERQFVWRLWRLDPQPPEAEDWAGIEIKLRLTRDLRPGEMAWPEVTVLYEDADGELFRDGDKPRGKSSRR